MQFTKNNIKGFTLIELLVVITIIGILAVGGTTVYTSQIQKARDTTRLGDVKALQGALEQVFSDMASYPNTQPYTTPLTDCSSSNATNSNMDCVRLLGFMVSLPKDPKNSQSGNNSPLDYTYNVRDIGGVLQQAYEVSTGVENDGNRTSKGGQDGGNDTNRYEIWNLLSINTAVWASASISTAASAATNIPAGTKSCKAVNDATPSPSTSSAEGTQILIRGNCQP